MGNYSPSPGHGRALTRTLAAVEIIVVGAGGVVALSWVVAGLLLRRSRKTRRSAQAAAEDAAGRLAAETKRSELLAAGEREAAWSTGAMTRIAEARLSALDSAATALETAGREAASLESTIDAVRDDLRATQDDLAAARRDLGAAGDRLAELETELAQRAPQAQDQDASDLAERVAALSEELADARRSVAAHAAEARELRHRLAVAQQTTSIPSSPSLDDLRSEVESLRRQAADPGLQIRIAELEATLTAERSRFAAAASVVPADPETASRIAELDAKLSAADVAAAAATQRRVALESAMTELRARAAAGEREAELLREHVEAGRLEIERLRSAADDARREADRRVAAAAARITDLEKSARSGDRDSAILTARDALIADLEQRLAALGSARNAELRRLNDKITSMERLYVDVEVRDRRISTLEEDLKDTAEARDAALAEIAAMEREAIGLRTAHGQAAVALERFAGIERELLSTRARVTELEQQLDDSVLGPEVERLRRALEAERDRADRAVQRSALAEDRPVTYAAWDTMARARIETAVAEAVRPLQARVDHLHEVVIEKERRLAALTQPPTRPAGPDDLTRIRGIGPKISAILHGLGITTFRDIASFSDDDVLRVGAHLPVYGGRIIDDDWIVQARDLAG